MAANSLHPDEVKRICDRLECSPSQHDKMIGFNPPTISRRGISAASGTGAVSDFGMGRKSGRSPGFRTKFARGARETTY